MKAEPDPPHSIRRRIVLATFGSLGDLHPYVALALELRARGHEAILATSANYREKIEALGIGFASVRPDIPDDPDFILPFFDPLKGPERLVREFMMPVLRESYEDMLEASRGADLLVGHPLTFSVRLVAEKQRIPWASTVLAPLAFFSVHDPPVLAPAPFLSKLRFLGPTFYRPLFRFMMHHVRSWTQPWHALRRELGLPGTSDDPMFLESASRELILAMYSDVIGARQPDWPEHTVVTGFAFYDRDGEAGLPPELARFLDAGEPPIVFTLGSSAVLNAGKFYEHSAQAAKWLGRRAVLLVGKETNNRPATLPPNVAAFDYAPYSELFHRAAVIVHSGGIGTTGQGLRSGRPMLVVPFAFDQPDNADRARRIGVARVIPQHRYDAERATRELERLLRDPSFANRASEVGRRIERENGTRRACDLLEGLLSEPDRVRSNDSRRSPSVSKSH
jgi:UDP:flavonoid glycosyltransferase YjiC (YdhE family)